QPAVVHPGGVQLEQERVVEGPQQLQGVDVALAGLVVQGPEAALDGDDPAARRLRLEHLAELPLPDGADQPVAAPGRQRVGGARGGRGGRRERRGGGGGRGRRGGGLGGIVAEGARGVAGGQRARQELQLRELGREARGVGRQRRPVAEQVAGAVLGVDDEGRQGA